MQTQANQQVSQTPCAREQLQGFAVVVVSAAVMVGLAFGAMHLLSSPAGWATKVANQAIATSYAMNLGE